MKTEYIIRKAKDFIPWRLRYWLKIMEAKHPGFIPGIWKQKSDLEYYNQVFYDALNVLGLKDLKNKTICEMGPGQFLSHAFLSFQLGAERSYLLEIADFANCKKEVKMNADLFLPENMTRIRKLPRPSEHISWKEYLKAVQSRYYTNGLSGYKGIPDNSVNLVCSFSVIEHIRKNVFEQTMQETYRFLQGGGIAYHTVDLKDHFGGGKNHLRFEEHEWEDDIHYRMDNYTNRLSFSEICSIWKRTGFSIEIIDKAFMDEKNRINRKNLASSLKHMSDEDLMISEFTAVLRKE